MANWRFVLIDRTTDVTPPELRPFKAFDHFIDAIGYGLAHEWADEWGAEGWAFRIAAGPDDRREGEVAWNYRDTIPEAPGALAYHQVTNGVPDIEMGCDLFPDLYGEDGMMKGSDHEVKELLLDPGANASADLGDGSGNRQALEACDLVQNTQYLAGDGDGYLSNFLRKAAFIPGSTGPWDYLGVMKTQGDTSNGYQILYSNEDQHASFRRVIHQVKGWNDLRPIVRLRKLRSLRLARRGLFVPAK